MSMLSCPLCGRLVSLRHFAPEDFDENIQVVSRRSLGRGRGFEVTGRYSVLDDEELMERIATRLHLLLNLIEGEDANPEKGEDEYEEAEEEDDRELLVQVNEALSNVYDGCFTKLDTAVRTLIQEYNEVAEKRRDEV